MLTSLGETSKGMLIRLYGSLIDPIFEKASQANLSGSDVNQFIKTALKYTIIKVNGAPVKIAPSNSDSAVYHELKFLIDGSSSVTGDKNKLNREIKNDLKELRSDFFSNFVNCYEETLRLEVIAKEPGNVPIFATCMHMCLLGLVDNGVERLNAESQKARLQKDNSALRTTVRDNENKVTELSQLSNQLAGQVEQQSAVIDKVSQELSGEKQKTQELQHDKTRLKLQHQVEVAELILVPDMLKHYDGLVIEISANKEKIVADKQRKSVCEKSMADKESKLLGLAGYIQRTRDDLTRAEEELTFKLQNPDNEFAKLKAEVDSLSDDQDDLASQLQNYEGLKASHVKRNKLDKAAAIESQIAEAVGELTEVKKALAEKSQLLSELEKTNELRLSDLRLRVTTLTEQLETTLARQTTWQEEVSDLQGQIITIDDELNALFPEQLHLFCQLLSVTSKLYEAKPLVYALNLSKNAQEFLDQLTVTKDDLITAELKENVQQTQDLIRQYLPNLSEATTSTNEASLPTPQINVRAGRVESQADRRATQIRTNQFWDDLNADRVNEGQLITRINEGVIPSRSYAKEAAGDQKPLIHHVILKGLTKVALLMLKQSTDVNLADNKGNTLLHLAIYLGINTLLSADNMTVIQLLLAQGARLDLKNKVGDTALHLAARSRSMGGYLALLLNKACDVSIKNLNDDSVLDVAVRAGNYYATCIILKMAILVDGCLIQARKKATDQKIISVLEKKLQERGISAEPVCASPDYSEDLQSSSETVEGDLYPSLEKFPPSAPPADPLFSEKYPEPPPLPEVPAEPSSSHPAENSQACDDDVTPPPPEVPEFSFQPESSESLAECSPPPPPTTPSFSESCPAPQPESSASATPPPPPPVPVSVVEENGAPPPPPLPSELNSAPRPAASSTTPLTKQPSVNIPGFRSYQIEPILQVARGAGEEEACITLLSNALAIATKYDLKTQLKSLFEQLGEPAEFSSFETTVVENWEKEDKRRKQTEAQQAAENNQEVTHIRREFSQMFTESNLFKKVAEANASDPQSDKEDNSENEEDDSEWKDGGCPSPRR